MSVIWHLFNLWKQHVIENEFSNPTCEVSTGNEEVSPGPFFLFKFK